MRRIALALGLVMLAALPLLADPPAPDYDEYYDPAPTAPNTQEENKTLKTILVIDEFQGEQQSTAKLPDEVKFIADALGLKGATYTLEGSVLKVGYDEPELVKGVQLAKIEPFSDCPNNTQFHVETPLVKADAYLKKVMYAWTQVRHRDRDAKLLSAHAYNEFGDKPKRRFDVQIDVNKIAVLIE